MNRRDFLRMIGLGSLAGAAAIVGAKVESKPDINPQVETLMELMRQGDAAAGIKHHPVHQPIAASQKFSKGDFLSFKSDKELTEKARMAALVPIVVLNPDGTWQVIDHLHGSRPTHSTKDRVYWLNHDGDVQSIPNPHR